MPDQEEREEPAASAGEEQGIRSMIHGHSVGSSEHDKGPRSYLRGLDKEEAIPIFDHARIHGDTQIEIRKTNGVRENYGIDYKAGRYTIKDQGKQKVSNPEKK